MVSQSYSLSRESTDSYGKLIRQYMQKLSGGGYYQGEYTTKTGDTATVFHRCGEQVWSQRKNRQLWETDQAARAETQWQANNQHSCGECTLQVHSTLLHINCDTCLHSPLT